jgi:hypothetical protein
MEKINNRVREGGLLCGASWLHWRARGVLEDSEQGNVLTRKRPVSLSYTVKRCTATSNIYLTVCVISVSSCNETNGVS